MPQTSPRASHSTPKLQRAVLERAAVVWHMSQVGLAFRVHQPCGQMLSASTMRAISRSCVVRETVLTPTWGLMCTRHEFHGRGGLAASGLKLRVRTSGVRRLRSCSGPTPLPPMLTMVALALHLRWIDMAALVFTSFVAMLRPAEALALTRADVLLPSDLLESGHTAYVRVSFPKMRRLTARREHVRVADPSLAFLLAAWFRHLQPHQSLLDAGCKPGPPRSTARCTMP